MQIKARTMSGRAGDDEFIDKYFSCGCRAKLYFWTLIKSYLCDAKNAQIFEE
jgi:hypothetical protein